MKKINPNNNSVVKDAALRDFIFANEQPDVFFQIGEIGIFQQQLLKFLPDIIKGMFKGSQIRISTGGSTKVGIWMPRQSPAAAASSPAKPIPVSSVLGKILSQRAGVGSAAQIVVSGMEPVSDPRLQALESIDLLDNTENVAFRLSTDYLKFNIDNWFHTNYDAPLPNPYNLTPPVVTPMKPNTIKTIINGCDHTDYGDVNLKVIMTDTLSIVDKAVCCTPNNVLEKDPSGEFEAVVAIISFLTFGIFGYEVEKTLSSINVPSDIQSPGTQVAAQIPRQFLIPGPYQAGDKGLKIAMLYDRVFIDDYAIVAAGQLQLENRQPSVVILPTIFGIFSAFTTDLRDPLTYAWTVNGKPYNGNESVIQIKGSGMYAVEVTVTDADAVPAVASVNYPVIDFGL
jgi:hypothetical protein